VKVIPSASRLRRLFVTMLEWLPMNEPRRLWDQHCNPHLIEDFLWRRRSRTMLATPYDIEQATGQALHHIHSMCQERGLDFDSYGLPSSPQDTCCDWFTEAVQRERNFSIDEQQAVLNELLPQILDNPKQKEVWDAVMAALQGDDHNVIYVDGAAGTGKTTVYKTILAHLRVQGLLALPHAFFGIAAQLLDGGRTIHSRFRLPVPLPLSDATCNLTHASPNARILHQASLLIIDEAPNMPLAAIEAIDVFLRELMGCSDRPFGGKVVLLGGDFRQIPPVIRRIDPDTLR